MNIGWLSVSPRAMSGYGGQTREICSRLLKKYSVITIGHEPDAIVWGGRQEIPLPNGKKILTLVIGNPQQNEKVAREMVEAYIKKYGFDIIIAHWDAMALNFLQPLSIPYIVYIPVDGVVTNKWANYVRYAYKIVLYSQYGYREMLKFFHPSRLAYIPHGVSDVFKPLNESKEELRKKINAVPPIPEDCYLMVDVSANVGPRKNLPLLMRTFMRFAEKYKKAHMYIHTNAHMEYSGYDLLWMADMWGIKDRIHFPKENPLIMGASDEEMVVILNSADIFVHESCAEGFGLPAMEGMACGIPAILPRNSAQEEIVEGHGWLIENIDIEDYIEFPVYVPYCTSYAQPSQRSLLEKMEEAYNNPDLRKKYGLEARKFAKKYSWEKLMPKWFKLLEGLEDDLKFLREVATIVP